MRKHIDHNDQRQDIEEIGYVVSVRNYLLALNGLPRVALDEIVETADHARGLVTGLKADVVEVLMLDDVKVFPQQQFFRTKKTLTVPVGKELIGRTINALGAPIDGKGKINITVGRSIYQTVRGIKSRQTIKRPLETGIATVDTLVPLARGQRQFIVGDVRSGKIGFLMDIIRNVKDADILCIYAMVGKRSTEIRQILDTLETSKALSYTIVIASSSSDLPSLVYLTPTVALTIAEYFQAQGQDVMVVLDDIGDHAKFYREISLLEGKTPGRESYPGDTFFQHAHLMERGGSFNKEHGGGSITIFPVINVADPTTFMPTNIMAMTDGHLAFDLNLYHQGVRPAIDTFLSVSRVGRQTQTPLQQMIGDKVRSTIREATRIESLSRLGGEVSKKNQEISQHKRMIDIILRQAPGTRIPPLTQVVLLTLVYTPFLSDKDEAFLEKNLSAIIDHINMLPDVEQVKKIPLQEQTWKKLFDIVTTFIPGIQGSCTAYGTNIMKPHSIK